MSRFPDFAQRFRSAVKAREISTTQKALGRFFGVSEITARNWWHGEKLPGMENARQAAKKLGVNTEWLLTGSGLRYPGAPLKSPLQARAGGEEDAHSVNDENGGDNYALAAQRNHVRWAPVVSSAQAGQFAEVSDPYEPGDADRWMPIPPSVKCSDLSYWAEIAGNSMVNTTGVGESFPPGTFVLIDPEIRDLITGRFVIARLSQTMECTFKRLAIEGNRRYLEPLNTQYSVIEMTEDSEIIGTKIVTMTIG